MAQTEKKKTSFKDILFGGNGGDSAYKIIYFSIVTYASEKGPETYVNLLYGDDTQAIFTNTLPLMGIMFSYNAELDAPYIKISKSFMPGRSKAEIILPTGYSFMAAHTPTVIAAIPTPEPVIQPAPQVVYQQAPVSRQSRGFTDEELGDLPEATISPDDVMKMVKEAESNVADHRNADGTYTYIDPEANKKVVGDTSNVIPDASSFEATFDTDILQDKVSKFLDKHERDEVKKEVKVKEVDPRTIDEVKRETVDDEMERLFGNAEKMRQIEEAANADAAAGKKE
jgi:hypothetical protein